MQTPHAPWFVAQTGAAPQPAPARQTSTVVWTVMLLIVAVMAGGLLVMLIRRKLLASDQHANPGGIMEDLRKMRDSGQMTQEEYEHVRRNMASKLAKSGFGDQPRASKGPRGA